MRAIWNEQPDPPQSGADYLYSLATTERRAKALARTLEGRLSPISRASRHRILTSPRMPVAGAYLVANAMMDGFMAELDRLEDETVEATIVCTGPWPPYSFVDREGDDNE